VVQLLVTPDVAAQLVDPFSRSDRHGAGPADYRSRVIT
jgi:hypothetical protein